MGTEHQYLTELEVAQMTKIALSTLRNHRFRGVGIPYHKIGRSVRYRLSDVLEYMNSMRISTADPKIHGCTKGKKALDTPSV